MKRPLPDILDSAVVVELLAHHRAHFGDAEIVGEANVGIPLHIGRRRVAGLVVESDGPEAKALALALDALMEIEGRARHKRRLLAERLLVLGERLTRAEQELAGPMHQQAERFLAQGGQLEEAATTCALTGVFNRRGLEMNLSALATAVIEEDVLLAVMMVDVDHFKSVNDNYGHLVGDQVLAVLGRAMLEGRRKNDVIGRWGGEEFLLALPDCPPKAASLIAESLRDRIANLSVDTEKGPLQFTASIGLAVGRLSPDGVDSGNPVGPAERLVARADECLYAAKEGGRNRVEVAELGAEEKE